jgi:hypothetical protein
MSISRTGDFIAIARQQQLLLIHLRSGKKKDRGTYVNVVKDHCNEGCVGIYFNSTRKDYNKQMCTVHGIYTQAF